VSVSVPGSLSGILNRGRRLSRAEERRVIARAQAGDLAARHALVEANLRLVLYVARRYQSSCLTVEDMVQEGVVGLLDALERYDLSAGHSFSSYAVPWIRLRIGRAVYRMGRIIRLPERGERLLARWNQLCDQAADMNQPPPTVEQGARALGVSAETLACVLEAGQPLAALHAVDGDSEGHAAEELVADPRVADPLAGLAEAEEWGVVRRAIAQLRPNYRRVLEESYGLNGHEPRTLNDLARQWGVTKQAVSGLRKRALESLRERVLAA
jgi:RNA polymerase sigma factor (sigma-70 family)